MDITALSTGLAEATAQGGVQTSVLKSVENLQQAEVSRLFANLGIGQHVDVYA